MEGRRGDWNGGERRCCFVRFYAELNDFLPPEKRQATITHFFFGRPSVKDLVESLGVPHTEIDLILANGESVDFSYRVQEGDRISVYPVFESIDITSVLRVRPEPLREVRFVLDGHLGRLASYLRMLGFDALYSTSFDDERLAVISAEERRILLTRDRGLLKRSAVTHGYLVRSSHPREQVAEVMRRFDLAGAVRPFSRCMCCNGELKSVSKKEVADRLPDRVKECFHEFSCCRACGRVYWKGSHYDRMRAFINRLQG